MYQCALTGVSEGDVESIVWRINGTISSASPSWQSYLASTGITVIGAGTLNTTLTIPGEPVLNETTVECISIGTVSSSDSAILYIQGGIIGYTRH